MRLALTGRGESSNYYPATCSVGVLLFFLCSLALLPVCVLNHFPHRGYKLEARPPEDHSRRESHSSVTHSTLAYTIHFTFTPLFCFALFLKCQDSAKRVECTSIQQRTRPPMLAPNLYRGMTTGLDRVDNNAHLDGTGRSYGTN